VGQWITDGVIASDTAATLRARWDQPGLGLVQIIKYVGFAGGLLAFFGLLGLVAAMAESEGFGGFMLAGLGAAGLRFGIRLATDARGRYAISCNVVLALALIAFTCGVGLMLHALGLDESKIVFACGFVALPVAFALAYRFRNMFLLVIGLLAAFHWIGSWTSMLGQSTYAMEIEDPRLMCMAALLAVGVGVAHPRPSYGPRLFLAYQAVGLTYLNLSLLILTIDGHDGSALNWICLWALCGVGQIIAGARLHSALFTAFGVVAIAVNMYTRYYETFWDSVDSGLFFLAGGALMFGAGFAAERGMRTRQARQPAQPEPAR
jgi:hypothetical protein